MKVIVRNSLVLFLWTTLASAEGEEEIGGLRGAVARGKSTKSGTVPAASSASASEWIKQLRSLQENQRFCGTSWSDAATSCGSACPSGMDSECPQETQCYGGITSCSSDSPSVTNNYCGQSWADAAASCSNTCPGGVDSECPQGTQCYGGITSCSSNPPTVTTNYCGQTWADAAASCSNTCPGGVDSECPQGTQCYGGITSCSGNPPTSAPKAQEPSDPPTATTNYCGQTWADAAASCSNTCPGGVDSECPQGTQCYGGITSCSGDPPTATTNYCGQTWADAAASCSNTCPGGVDSECPQGTQCYGGITSCSGNPPTSAPKTQEPTVSPSTPKKTQGPTVSPSTPKPTVSPPTGSTTEPTLTANPSSSSRPTESAFPSSSPTAEPVVVDFDGIRNAFSLQRGLIQLNWFPATLSGNNDTEYNDTEPVYDVFVAPSDFDFRAILSNHSISYLIDLFENETLLEHYQVDESEADNFTITSTDYGEEKRVFVAANIGGIYSSNKLSQHVTVVTVSPHIRDEVNLVGLFVPTLNLEIRVEEAPNNTEHRLSFAGAVSLEAQGLIAGDYITGMDSDLVPFIRRVVRVDEVNPFLVQLVVIQVPLESVFDQLEISGALEVSQKPGGSALDGRRLSFFSDAWGWISDRANDIKNVIDDAIGTFFKFVENVAQSIVDTFKLMFGEEVVQDFSLVDVRAEWEHELVPDLVQVTGDITLVGNLVIGIQVKSDQLYARAGIEVEYSCGANVEVGREAETSLLEKEWEIISGKRKRKVFAVGPVPVVVHFEPKVSLVAEVTVSASAKIEVGASLSGGTSVTAIYDSKHDPPFYNRFVPPSLDSDYTLSIAAKVGMEASLALVLTFEVGLYEGLLNANAAVSLGIGMDVEAGVENIGNLPEFLPTISAFDLGIKFEIPFSGNGLYGEFDIWDTTLFEKTWPIIELPSVKIGLTQEQRCLLGARNGGNVAILNLEASEDYPSDALIKNGFDADSGSWWLYDQDAGWSIVEREDRAAVLERAVSGSSSPPARGSIAYAVEPRIPPLPLKILHTISLDSLVPDEDVQCTETAPCDGDIWFDEVQAQVSAEFNSNIFLSQPPDPNASPVPSTVYKFEDFITALKKLRDAGEQFQFWLGDDCSVESEAIAMVSIAAFLGQAMIETIIYDACDENNWDLWRADVYKEPTSPPELLAALYPMSSSCGQLGQRYADYSCPDECPQDLSMQITGTTNAAWIGAPPPLFCGPKSVYDGLGYWNPMQFCQGPGNTCVDQPFYYEGQTAGNHVPVSEDDRFPAFFYTNPLPDADGNTPPARSPDMFPPTNVEGCCWWGRGVIQTTGRCNFGKLNKYLGAGAGSNALYPDVNFCSNPQVICDGPSDLKWVAGIFFWVSDPQVYDRDGFNYKEGVKRFVEMGCAQDPDKDGCGFLFEYASGIVNRGCHDPGTTGCPGCIPGSTCDPAHKIPERVAASKQVLRALMATVDGGNSGGGGGGGEGGGGGGGGGTSTNYCGTSWGDAATSCAQSCPGGVDGECPSGTQCYGGITGCS
ncbi:hypothetical protein ACA910_010031 [Epithemia clementina (nom. ined.)]